MITVNKINGRKYKVLVLPDVQLVLDDVKTKNEEYSIAFSTIAELINRVAPDFIVLLGDLSNGFSLDVYTAIGDYIEGFKKDWSLVWGNHDNQGGGEFIENVSDVFLSRYKKLKFEKGDKKLGNGNFLIEVKNENKVVSGLIFMDTHDRDIVNGKECWAKLNDAQAEWYKSTISKLKSDGCFNSVIFMHIPFMAYKDAFDAAIKPEYSDKKISPKDSYDQIIWNDGYKNSVGVKYESVSAHPLDDFFKIVENNGMKNYIFAGHDHVNNYIIDYKNSKLIYALKTGIGCYYSVELCGGTVLEITDDGLGDVYHEYTEGKKNKNP